MRQARKILLCLLLLSFLSCEKTDSYSKRQLLPADPVLHATSAYIAVLGDIQIYTAGIAYMSYLEGTMDWLWSQKRHGTNIACILQDGDVSDNNDIHEWERFRSVTEMVAAETPFITCTGNHDYDWDKDYHINDRRSTHINEYASFPLTLSRIDASFEPDRIENVVIRNEIAGERYDILVLEFGPRTEVLDWAREYVSSRPDRKFILMTHEFLSREGERVSGGSYAGRQLRNTTWSSPEDVWRNLVKDNDNIVCVLCGHNGFSTRLYSTNSFGREVPQILFNLQYQEYGGDGWIQLWEFPDKSDSVSVSVYNTIRREMHPDPATRFKFRYRY